MADGAAMVLASASEVRARLLTNAGVPYAVDPANVDEAHVRDTLLAGAASHAAIAETLAELKAQHVAERHAGELVLGADQILSCEGELFEKPRGPEHVAGHLRALMGKSHTLHTSACVVRDGAVLWHVTTHAELAMRELSDEFIAAYVDRVGEAVCASVGAYQLEGLGAQLFERIDGAHFDILGLPLLPLLAFLRDREVIAR